MPNSIERRKYGQPRSVICVVGYVLRQREWAKHGNECLNVDGKAGHQCPHPDTCDIKNREEGEKK